MSLQLKNRIGRIFFAVVLAMAGLLAMQSQANAAVCKAQFDDIGTIIGKGSNLNSAREDATIKCFDKKEAKMRRASASLDEETGLAIIDICANIRCG